MTTTEKRKQILFGFSLLVIALVVNATVLTIQQQLWPSRFLVPRAGQTVQQQSFPQPLQQPPTLTYQQQLEIQKAATQRAAQEEAAAQRKADREAAQARQKAAEDAAAAHARYLARYVNTGFTRKPGIFPVGIVLSAENQMANGPVGNAIAARFKSETVEIVSDLLKPALVSDGLFADIFGGSRDVLSKLELANSIDVLVLVRESVRYVTNPSLNDLITANMQVDVKAMSVAASGQNQSWTFIANGPGFTQEAARKAAEERIIKQIAGDNRISVDQISPNNR